MRLRAAPMARRMASSWRRLEARASRRLETLAQAIKSTKPTTIMSIPKKAANGASCRDFSRSMPTTGATSTLFAQEAFAPHPGG